MGLPRGFDRDAFLREMVTTYGVEIAGPAARLLKDSDIVLLSEGLALAYAVKQSKEDVRRAFDLHMIELTAYERSIAAGTKTNRDRALTDLQRAHAQRLRLLSGLID
jgi:hypothetical protein